MLSYLENILQKKDFSKLIGLWKFFGFLIGFIPSMLGRNFIYTTIYYVETFVEKHYQEQLNMLDKNEQSKKLRKIIEDLMKDEIDHKDDAKKYLKNLTIFIVFLFKSLQDLTSLYPFSLMKVIALLLFFLDSKFSEKFNFELIKNLLSIRFFDNLNFSFLIPLTPV